MLSGLLISGCQPDNNEPVEPIVRPVKLFIIQDSTQEQIRKFPGNVTASEEASISFRVPGQLTALLINEAQQVQQGDLLAKLDNTDFQNELANRKASYELARVELERSQSLLKRKVISKAQFDKAQAQFKSNQAALDLATSKLEYTKIHAPFDGRIARVDVENFQFVEAKQTILLLQNNSTVDVHIQIPENIIIQVDAREVDMTYQPYALFNATPQRKFPLVYKEHSTKVTPGTQTYEVVMTMTLPPDLTILPGMTTVVIADLARIFRKKATIDYLLIPLSAILKQDSTGKTIVWSFNRSSKTVKATTVKTGRVTELGVEILNGLESGDVIVSAGVSQLSEGMQVKPLHWERGL